MRDELDLLPELLLAHLELTLLALAAGALLAIPLGVWVTRRRRWEGIVLAGAGIVQTIPGLALLAVMVPALAWLGTRTAGVGLELRAIGFLPAFLALTLYSVLPMLRNTVTGLRGVDPAVRDAARAVGMTPRQRLWRVELPLALPTVVAGVRTAAVWTVGMATLSTPVGAPSLGNFIFSGLQTRNHASVLVGCVAAAGLALVLDGLVRLVEVGLSRRRRGVVAAAGGTLSVLLVIALAGLVGGKGDDAPIRIGAKTFTEQYVLAALLEATLEEAGLPAETVSSLGSTVAFDALVAGEIDVYVDYSGTIYATVMRRELGNLGRDEVLDEVTRYLEDERGVLVLGSLGFENTYALALRGDRARELGTLTISDLAPHAPHLDVGGDYELFRRAEWAAIEDGYGLAFQKKRTMDPALLLEALLARELDVVGAYSTDGRLAAHDLVVLEDDRAVIPPYDAILLVAADAARRHPDLVPTLRPLVGTIDADTMRRANLAVDGEGRSPSSVARELSQP